MNTQSSDPNSSNNPADNRRADRQQRREERRAARGGRLSSGWIGGGLLIVIGVAFLLQNLGALTLGGNWWALFILIPAVGAFAAAWRSYQNAGGHLNAAARGSLIGGLILTMVAAIFLFNLNWGLLGPVLLVLAGIGILLNTSLPG
jgi:hypothetical protein